MSAKEKMPMSEEKQKRLVVAMTVAGVLLTLFLVVILVVQFVQIGVYNAQIAEYEKQLEEYTELRKADERDLAYYQTERGLYILALQHGWSTPKN